MYVFHRQLLSTRLPVHLLDGSLSFYMLYRAIEGTITVGRTRSWMSVLEVLPALLMMMELSCIVSFLAQAPAVR
jgi:hypothetical protein